MYRATISGDGFKKSIADSSIVYMRAWLVRNMEKMPNNTEFKIYQVGPNGPDKLAGIVRKYQHTRYAFEDCRRYPKRNIYQIDKNGNMIGLIGTRNLRTGTYERSSTNGFGFPYENGKWPNVR